MTMLGGVYVGSNHDVRFGGQHCAAGAMMENDPEQLKIDESDFTAVFDGVKWTMEWKWENGEPTMANQCSEYAVPNNCREIFEDEVSQWISNGWLEKSNPHVHGKADDVIPLMAVRQPNKPKKVRPVMDYRQLNTFIKSNPGIDVTVCQEKLRAWRKRDNQASILDLRKAHLQIHVSEQLQRFQLMKFKGQIYVMKRMGFGLSVAPKIMSRIIALAKEVRRLLSKESLETKEPVPLTNSHVLGLRVIKDPDNQYKWYRDGVVPILQEIPTKLPARAFAKEFMNRISQHDPVTGCWSVSNVSEGVVWCDASSLAVGCCLEIDGSIVEKATWLRKVHGSHINAAELEAVIKGLHIALRWGIVKLKILTDSAIVYGWVRSILVDSKRPKANVLTRVLQKWLNSPCLAVVTLDDKTREITKLHGKHHLGVKKTLYLAKRVCGQDVDQKVVKQVVDSWYGRGWQWTFRMLINELS
ncbi:uncharacterized protein [Watersipora subatra]|uniref:uncharacterized protein n=1 Tax=Watersipora subatra TaxID=2589382 RepID=UPI00355AFCD6